MTYYGGKEMAAAFRTVRNNTIRIATEIPEEHYGFRPAEGTRSVAETLAHIALGVRLPAEVILSGRTDLDGFNYLEFRGRLQAESNLPRTKDELLALLSAEGEKFATQLEGLTDEFLGQSITFPAGANPPSRTRFDLLLAAKEHEMHHRSQLMLIQRMHGLTPHLTREADARLAAMQAQARG